VVARIISINRYLRSRVSLKPDSLLSCTLRCRAMQRTANLPRCDSLSRKTEVLGLQDSWDEVSVPVVNLNFFDTSARDEPYDDCDLNTMFHVVLLKNDLPISSLDGLFVNHIRLAHSDVLNLGLPNINMHDATAHRQLLLIETEFKRKCKLLSPHSFYLKPRTSPFSQQVSNATSNSSKAFTTSPVTLPHLFCAAAAPHCTLMLFIDLGFLRDMVRHPHDRIPRSSAIQPI
jgi:hypothetical protein